MSDAGLIELIEVSEPSEGNVQYDIQFRSDRPNGFVSLNFSEFQHYITGGMFRSNLKKNPEFGELSLWEDYSVFARLGIKPGDMVVYLNQFHPNGQGLTGKQIKKYSRRGVGSEIFERVIEDSLDRNVKLMTTYATTYQMRKFAKKNCFTHVKEDSFYLLL